jgi:hypothetical protein
VSVTSARGAHACVQHDAGLRGMRPPDLLGSHRRPFAPQELGHTCLRRPGLLLDRLAPRRSPSGLPLGRIAAIPCGTHAIESARDGVLTLLTHHLS